MDSDFSEQDIQRYARHILLAEVGGTGQQKLLNAKILIVGAGGLGSPLALYLAAAGIGTIGLVDDDIVALSNLQRQIAHTTAAIGTPKVFSAAQTALAINPGITLQPHQTRLTAANAAALIAPYDLICDGTDNFAARYLLADACHLAGKTLISAAILRFEAQLATFPPAGPCYRCLYPTPPPQGLIPSCSEAGILGAVAGVAGTLQATEALKQILGIGAPSAGRLLLWDALSADFHTVKFARDPTCALCGDHPTITDLSAHDD